MVLPLVAGYLASKGAKAIGKKLLKKAGKKAFSRLAESNLSTETQRQFARKKRLTNFEKALLLEISENGKESKEEIEIIKQAFKQN